MFAIVHIFYDRHNVLSTGHECQFSVCLQNVMCVEHDLAYQSCSFGCNSFHKPVPNSSTASISLSIFEIYFPICTLLACFPPKSRSNQIVTLNYRAICDFSLLFHIYFSTFLKMMLLRGLPEIECPEPGFLQNTCLNNSNCLPSLMQIIWINHERLRRAWSKHLTNVIANSGNTRGNTREKSWLTRQ